MVVGHDGAMPQLMSVGPAYSRFVPELAGQPVPHASTDVPIEFGIIAEHATGYTGRPGLRGSRPDGTAWSPRFAVRDVVASDDGSTVAIELGDDIAELGLTLRLTVDDVLTVSATLHNHGDQPYGVLRLAPSIPVPDHMSELLTFTGRWCREFQPARAPLVGTTVVENRTGRTSHTRLPALFAGPAGFDEEHGEVFGVQLAWSGNYEIAAERLPDGRCHIQAGELLEPGEVTISPGEQYTGPDVVVAWSPAGLGGASDAFHRAVRRHSPIVGERPVILNTWEAVYFDHRFDTLQQLADVASSVGVERFVLDDGWFGGRRDDTAGLGDWWVSDAVWPSGLAPIVDHVTSLGMEFGLWVEPEMVNPDSDLYRKHPEWTLTTHGYDPVLWRNQLVLDLGRPEVRDFLFDAIDALLREYDISFLKWDMNRNVIQGSRGGRAAAHGHVIGVYELIDRLRAAHPGVEIESCASGGGRADLGVLRRTERIWTSDCNDAVERQRIQRGFSMLFPPEVMGAHIGPDRAHTTLRRHDLGFRAATALFGHLGIEWNLLDADDDQRRQIAATIQAYRRLRSLLHGGRVVRVDHPDDAALVHGVVAGDGAHGVFAYVQLVPSAETTPAPMRLRGLDPRRSYRVSVLDDLDSAKYGGRDKPSWMRDGLTAPVDGRQLAERGLQLPVLHPESVVVIEVVAVDADAAASGPEGFA